MQMCLRVGVVDMDVDVYGCGVGVVGVDGDVFGC